MKRERRTPSVLEIIDEVLCREASRYCSANCCDPLNGIYQCKACFTHCMKEKGCM